MQFWKCFCFQQMKQHSYQLRKFFNIIHRGSLSGIRACLESFETTSFCGPFKPSMSLNFFIPGIPFVWLFEAFCCAAVEGRVPDAFKKVQKHGSWGAFTGFSRIPFLWKVRERDGVQRLFVHSKSFCNNQIKNWVYFTVFQKINF